MKSVNSSLAVEGLLLISSIALLFLYIQKQKADRKGEKPVALETKQPASVSASDGPKVAILYGTTTGVAKKFATTLEHHLRKRCPGLTITVTNLKDYSDDQLDKEDIALFILSTWEGGKPPASCSFFAECVDDMAHDFRVSKDMLSQMRYAVFGLGTKYYADNFCQAAIGLDANLAELGGQRLFPLALGDDNSNLEQAFYRWNSTVAKYIAENVGSTIVPKPIIKEEKKGSSSCCNSKKPSSSTTNADQENAGCCSEPPADDELEAEDLINNSYVDFDLSATDLDLQAQTNAKTQGKKVMDLEDIGPTHQSAQQPTGTATEPREMVTKLQRKALTKEGYKIIGSHSAVKLCRWTKNQLRGRGGCYKHSFYGITSYQCMEATPSLACANKCVFCWRHHKNPVGTDWRWKEDAPDMIVQQAIQLHVEMIHQMKGVPGVLAERFEEAHRVAHCALSLVGEPIMYPRINEMLSELHRRDISTFLVTNAQFPERIEQLDPVTQLYVSIDAATKESLKAIDRPLFKDFWERYLASLEALKSKQQRTVYRMTLVKAWNMEELDGYAQLIEFGMPDFIEIKAVTYCGKSDASSLTMQNVPWHEEVCQYAQHLCDRLQARQQCGKANYSIATEHQHSCCILIAREDKFKVNGEWQTWIDYPKFHALMRNYYASNKTELFRSEEYMAPTPQWAVYQSKERGFDPVEQRWRRGDNKATDPALEPEANESGCG